MLRLEAHARTRSPSKATEIKESGFFQVRFFGWFRFLFQLKRWWHKIKNRVLNSTGLWQDRDTSEDGSLQTYNKAFVNGRFQMVLQWLTKIKDHQKGWSKIRSC